MTIIYPDKKFQHLLQEPTAVALLAYFKHQTGPVILRQIRQAVEDPHLDKTLDELITYGVILRQERRYLLDLPQLTAWPEVTPALFAGLSELKASYSPIVLNEACTKLLAEHPITQPIELTFELPYVTQLENDDYRLVTLNHGGQQTVSLPNYFAVKASDEALPAVFNELEHLIGDVDPVFFFNQIGVIFEQVATGHLRTRRPSIFRESLSQTGILDETTQQLLIPQVTEALGESPLAELAAFVPETAPLDHLTLQWIRQQLTPDSLTYLIKKESI